MTYDTNIRFLAQFYALPELEKQQFLNQLSLEQEDKTIELLSTEWGEFANHTNDDEHEQEQWLESLLNSMSLEQKVRQMTPNITAREAKWYYKSYCNPAVISGEDVSLNIPGVRFTDGPCGIVMGFGETTQFPAAIARASSFDRDLEYRVGVAIGKEGRAMGANYFGGVCINLIRHPAWGRAQETYGEDPVLLGEMGASFVEGIQTNMMACVKHFAVNSMENARFQVDIKVDERTLREVYLPHFKRCVDAGCASIMSAYNRVNGEWCGHNAVLLREILKEEWGFEGFVISDFIWGTRDTVDAANGGLDMEMHIEQYFGNYLVRAVKDGLVPQSAIDEAAKRIVSTKLKYATLLGDKIPSKSVCACKEHIELAREVAEKSVVLLKNNDNLLPFSTKKIRRIAVVGRLAKEEYLGDMKGSTAVFPPYCISLYEGLKRYEDKGVIIDYCSGEFADEVRHKCANADAVIVVAGLTYKDEGEYLYVNMAIGGDRDNLSLRSEDIDMICCAADANSNTVVCLQGGSTILTSGWDEKVKAILMTWYPGMEGGAATSDILFGAVNPSAKMPLSVPYSEGDLPYFDKDAKEIIYDFYHGYFMLDKNGRKARYPFGYGLSYTTFAYKDLIAERHDDNISVEVEVANTGVRVGTEVVQLYIGYTNPNVERHVKDLKDFMRINLLPGESKKVCFTLPVSAIDYFDTVKRTWVHENSDIIVMVGSSSDSDSLLCINVGL